MAQAEAAVVPRLDSLDGWPNPESQPAWLGDRAAEATLLDAYRGGRMHHAWLIGGPKGIGKATLAYRFARFAFAHPDPQSGEVAAATSLAVDADHPAFHRVANRAHANLLALERPYREDRKRFLTELSVDQIRRTVAFFGSTSGERGLAHRDRRSGRRDERQCRQCASEGARGAADPVAVLHHLPCARPVAPDHPLPLPPSRSRAAVDRGDRGRAIRDNEPGRFQRCATSRSRRRSPRAASGGRSCSSRTAASPPIADSPLSPRRCRPPTSPPCTTLPTVSRGGRRRRV